MQVDGCIWMPFESGFGNGYSDFCLHGSPCGDFPGCFEIALLRDRKVPHVMYAIQFKDISLASEKEDQEQEQCWTLPLSA